MRASWLLWIPVLFFVLALPVALHHWAFRPGTAFRPRHFFDFWLTIVAVLVVVVIAGVALVLLYVETNQ